MISFKIMTWNVENLFPVGSISGPKTQQEYDSKLEYLAKVISEQKPDVIALQEIGDQVPFADLYNRVGIFTYKQLSARPDPRGLRVGIFSNLTMESSEEIVDFPQELPSVPGIDDKGNSVDITRMGRGAL